jgi:predicted nucleic acid-binding protein
MADIVLDASVAAKAMVPEQYSDLAISLIEDSSNTDVRLVALFLLPVEVTNVIRRRMRLERVSLMEATRILDDFLALPIELLGGAGLHRLALRLTEAHSLGAHDAHYVALAQLLNCDLWTADQRILRAVDGRLPFVRWIGSYTPSSGSETSDRRALPVCLSLFPIPVT